MDTRTATPGMDRRGRLLTLALPDLSLVAQRHGASVGHISVSGRSRIGPAS